MKKIIISTASFGRYDKAPLQMLKKNKFKIALNPYGRQLSEKEIKGLLVDADGLIAGTEPLTQNVVKSAKNLKVISRCGAGIDNVDLEAVKKRGIQLYRTPDSHALAVAELTLGLMLDSLRYISYLNKKISKGGWEKKMGRLLSGKTIGIIGMGAVGKRLAVLLKPFSCKILARDPAPDGKFAKKNKFDYVSLKQLLNKSDIVTLHLPLTKKTNRFFNAGFFRDMKNGSVFINTSRGKLVDEDALFRALKTGKLSYAALDVFSEEPYKGKLRKLENITLTCHIGAYAKEARELMEKEAVENLLKGLERRGCK